MKGAVTERRTVMGHSQSNGVVFGMPQQPKEAVTAEELS